MIEVRGNNVREFGGVVTVAKLEVGDKVFMTDSAGYPVPLTVTRTTQTLVILKAGHGETHSEYEWRFSKKTESRLWKHGRDYSRLVDAVYAAHISKSKEEQFRALQERSQLIDRIRSTDWNYVSVEKRKRIVAILEEKDAQ